MKDTTNVYFADTYAIIEILGGNKEYQPFIERVLITTKLNLAELYYHLLKEYGNEIAEKYMTIYAKISIPITFSAIKKGMQLKLEYKKEKLSYADCIGYALALEQNIPFLTGDQKFKEKTQVEFRK